MNHSNSALEQAPLPLSRGRAKQFRVRGEEEGLDGFPAPAAPASG
jgi:hypothetical protein